MAKATTPVTVAGYVDQSFDHQADKTPTATKEYAVRSESEPQVEEGTNNALAVASKLAVRWDARNKREGKKVWFCPLSPAKERLHFDTKQQCQKYMTKEYAARIDQAKLEKRPKSEWTPQSEIQSPKRTMADVMLPGHARMAEAAQAAGRQVQQLGRASTADGKITAGVMVNLPESQAVPKVPGLDDQELNRCAYKAYFYGKQGLYKACKKEALKRGLKFSF